MSGERPRIVAKSAAYEGWNRLDVVTVESSDLAGRTTRVDREVVHHGDAAVVLTIDQARGVAVLVRQWRAPRIVNGDDPFLLEACAGIIDPGEDAETSARRECEEETGLRIGSIRFVATVMPSAGTLTERMHLFVAEVDAADRVGSGGGKAEEGESIEVVEVPLDELHRRAACGEIQDAKTLLLVQHLMLEELRGRRD